MNLLKKLSRLFTADSAESNFYPLTVQCNRCGEIIETQINLKNELSIEYDERGEIGSYRCRKVLVGKQRCFQSIEVTLTFSPQRRLVEQQITGGKFVGTITG